MAELRDYQKAAANAAAQWIRKSVEPGLLELATAAGKSHIVSALAGWFHKRTGRKVLCLQPTKELTIQNFEKYVASGAKASYYSASVAKSLKHPVVYGTPRTVLNAVEKFGDQFGLVIIDEAHGITPTIKKIVEAIRSRNKNLRVIGMTATPYRTVEGYIFRYWPDGLANGDHTCRDPWFNTLLYQVTARDLIDRGYVTPAHSEVSEAHYNTRGMKIKSNGKFDEKDIQRVFEGKDRLTAKIVQDVYWLTQKRRGVMFFASTVAHGLEILQSLPINKSAMIGGDINTKPAERDQLIADFKAQRIKYLVNVNILTTGFDAPHVDCIAVLRATESAGLFQQIIGRGLRLYDGKDDCLVLDYAENIERHGLEDDLFRPEIRVSGKGEASEMAEFECPDCGYTNAFSVRPNPAEFHVSDDGYFCDLEGNPIANDYGPIPAHFGRRCNGQEQDPDNPLKFVRCGYRWNGKDCEECGCENDIAARHCSDCKAELVDPNEKLKIDFKRIKADPYQKQTDKVLNIEYSKRISLKGNETLKVVFTTPWRKVSAFFTPSVRHSSAVYAWESLSKAFYSGHIAPDIDTFLEHLDKAKEPETITYKKRGDFFVMFDYNQPEDIEP